MASCSNDDVSGGGGSAGNDSAGKVQEAGLTLPAGFKAQKVIDKTSEARHIAIRENGDLYIALRKLKDGKGTVALRDTTGDGRADVVKYFGNFPGTGAAIHKGYLYRSSETAVYRYPLHEGRLLPEMNKDTILKGLPEQTSHAAKPIDFDEQGHMYINVGAPSNACMKQSRQKGSEGMEPCPLLKKHGGIWRYDAGKTGQTHTTTNRYATGMRNIVALDWNDRENALFLVQHGRDQLSQFFPDLYTAEENAKLPAEEFHKVNSGDNLGWPYCYYDQIQEKKVLSPEYGGEGDSVGRCDQYKDPLIGFPGHWGPNDLLFYSGGQFPEQYRHGAFITFHGSWNRAPKPQAGYKVVFVPFKKGKPAPEQDWFTFADGFKGKDTLRSPRNAEHRPMGLATGPDGALYVTDSRKGTVWRITHPD